LLIDLASAWIEKKNDIRDQEKVAEALSRYLRELEEGIKCYTIYVPINGLEVNSTTGVKIGRSILLSNTEDSEMRRLAQRTKEKLGGNAENLADLATTFEEATSFVKAEICAHHRRAIERAKEITEETLDVLRLYLGSFYLDIYRKPRTPSQMGVAGTLPHRKGSRVLTVRTGGYVEKQVPGASFEFEHYEPYSLTAEVIREMKGLGLSTLNSYLPCIDEASRGSAELRLYRAMSWFSKGTTASKVADSYLMYAIAAESLLSEGRTPQETYATWIASLVTRDGDRFVYPLGGAISVSLADRLKSAGSLSKRFSVIRERAIELFAYRNDIAHGQILDEESNPINLLDFETLVRNCILSFLVDNWESFADFKGWVQASTTLGFAPAT
jgi:hypothetical protein